MASETKAKRDSRVRPGQVFLISSDKGLFAWGDEATLIFATRRAAERFLEDRVTSQIRERFEVVEMALSDPLRLAPVANPCLKFETEFPYAD